MNEFMHILQDWVMEQASGSVSPWESLSADTQMFVSYKFWTWLFNMLLMPQVCVQHAQTNGWETDQECQSSPQDDFRCKR